MIAKQRSALQVYFITRRQTDLLLCTILLLPPLKSPSKHGRWRSSLLLYSISMALAYLFSITFIAQFQCITGSE